MPGMFGTSVFTGAASIVSGAASALHEHIQAGFPPRFFKHVHVGDSNVVLARRFQDAEDWKKPSRRMRITPSYSLDRPEYGGAVMMNRLHRPRGRVVIESTTHMTPLYENEEELRFIRFDLDRYRTSFELGFYLETPLQAANFRLVLEELVYPEETYFINGAAFPIRLPRPVATMLARDLDLPDPGSMHRADAERMIAELASASRHPLDWRVDPASGRGDVTFFWRASFVTRFERPSISTEHRDQVVSSSVVATSCAMEFSFPVYFVYASRTEPEEAERILAEERGESLAAGEGIYMGFRHNRLPPTREVEGRARRLRFLQGFAPQANEPVDTLGILDLVDPDLRAYIVDNSGTEKGRARLDHHLECVLADHTYGRPGADPFYEWVKGGGRRVDPDKFTMDWEAGEVVIGRPEINVNHQFAIYMDWSLLRRHMMERVGVPDDGFDSAWVRLERMDFRDAVGNELRTDSMLVRDKLIIPED